MSTCPPEQDAEQQHPQQTSTKTKSVNTWRWRRLDPTVTTSKRRLPRSSRDGDVYGSFTCGAPRVLVDVVDPPSRCYSSAPAFERQKASRRRYRTAKVDVGRCVCLTMHVALSRTLVKPHESTTTKSGTMRYLMVGAFASHGYRRQQTAFAELQGRRGWRVVPLCFSIRPRSRGRFRLEMHFECSSLRTTKRESDEDIRR